MHMESHFDFMRPAEHYVCALSQKLGRLLKYKDALLRPNKPLHPLPHCRDFVCEKRPDQLRRCVFLFGRKSSSRVFEHRRMIGAGVTYQRRKQSTTS
jgi:hypothetical protein